ncbi:MAG: hypothetical protein LBC83_05625 [Oscillospiraceae bacterium]|jgi:hypothetical protein|nr:hypothetical protein [Oscillospiraceae bacterium]
MQLRAKHMLSMLLLALLPAWTSCSLFSTPPPETAPAAKTPLPQGREAILAYWNEEVIARKRLEASDWNLEVSYSIGDVKTENATLRAAVPALKRILQDGLKGFAEQVSAARYPVLCTPLRSEDVAQLTAASLLEWELSQKDNLPAARADYESGALSKTELKKFLEQYGLNHLGLQNNAALDAWVAEQLKDTEQALRLYTMDTKLSSPVDAEAHYRMEAQLSDGSRYIAPVEKSAILAELAKAKETILVQDYTQASAAPFHLLAKVNRGTNEISELTLTAQYFITAQILGVNALANAGAAQAAFSIEKTVKLTAK